MKCPGFNVNPSTTGHSGAEMDCSPDCRDIRLARGDRSYNPAFYLKFKYSPDDNFHGKPHTNL